MQTFTETIFEQFENPQIVWELYGELLEFYYNIQFTAQQVADKPKTDKKLVNKVLHRLVFHQAVLCIGTDHWGVKNYRINQGFTG